MKNTSVDPLLYTRRAYNTRIQRLYVGCLLDPSLKDAAYTWVSDLEVSGDIQPLFQYWASILKDELFHREDRQVARLAANHLIAEQVRVEAQRSAR